MYYVQTRMQTFKKDRGDMEERKKECLFYGLCSKKESEVAQ